VTRDPAEGVDAAGYLVTGVGRDRVPAAYEPLLADCVGTLADDRLDGLYVYGSVATGQARPPASDLDLLAVWTAPADRPAAVDGPAPAGGPVPPPGVPALVAGLSARWAGLVREVGLASATVADLDRPADACFLRHYCVPLAGRDRRAELPRCRPSRALADGFNDDLPAVVARQRAAIAAAADRPAAVRRAARRLLLAVATIESVSHATWSTDRGTGAALLAAHHPEWAATADRMLTGTAGADEVLALGDWLVQHP
jgi:uncharacterized protein